MPGSIRALRRQADPVRGVGRIPIAKRRTVGRPQYRQTGTDTLSRQEEAIADAIEDAYASIPRETLLEAVERGDAAGYARTVLGYLTAASSGIEEVLLESFVSSGETSAIDLGRELSRQYRAVGKAETPSPSQVALRFRFNALDPRTTTWARNEAGRLITNMATSEQEMFRRLVTQSFTEGRTPQSTASSIFGQLRTVTPSPNAREFAEALGGNLNGLTERYERAVMNRVATVADDLAARGITGTKALDRMRREGDKYSEKLRRARSRTIARTERMRAHNEARLLSYQQAIDDGLMSREHSRKVWSTGPFDVCPICVGMAGTEAKMSEPFSLPNGVQVQSPPAHPNCRCTLQTRTDTTLYDPPQSLGSGLPGDPYRIGGRGVSDEGRKLDSPLTDTQRIHTVTRNGKSAYKPERIREVHDPWIRESLDDGVAYGDTQVTFMGGGSGAGKGSIQRSGDVTFRRGTTVVDSDEAKKAIPEYRELLDAGDNKAAAYVHEESSDMAQRLMAESIDRGYDTVLDGTGDSTFEKMAGKVARARQQGAQRVKAEYVTIDTDEALRRAAQRAARSGREVPEDVVTGTHEAVSKIFPKLADADTFDELRLWDNMGDTPELIYERVDGVERVLNRERYEAFLRKDPDYIPGSRQPLATPPATADDIIYGTNDTQGVYTEVVDGQRRYTAARTESVHRPWLDDLLSAGEASDEPTMTFLGGGSGAGKGTITNPDKGGVVQFRRGTIKVDSDEAKKAIPEYEQLVADKDPIAAAFVHEESSDMAAQALAESLDRGFDTVLDGTGDSSIEKLSSKVAKAREQGAKRVTAEYVTIDIDDAIRRATKRAQGSGREVPVDVIRGTHESVSRVLPEAIKRDLFDEVRLWDNTGTPPELIYEKIGGVERILNPERWEAFLRKNPDYQPRIYAPEIGAPTSLRTPGAIPGGVDAPSPAGPLTVDLDDLRPRARVITEADDFDDLIETEPMILTGKDGEQIDMGIRQPIRQAPERAYLRAGFADGDKLRHYDVTAVPAAADSLDAILEAGRRAGRILDDELERRLPNLVADAAEKKALLDEAEKALAERWSLQYEALHSGYRAVLREAAETAPTRYANILRKQADSDDLLRGFQTRPEPAKEKSVLNALRKVEDDNPIIEQLLRNRYDVADGVDLDDALRAQGMTRREAFDKVFGENGSDDLAQALDRLAENHPRTIEMRSEFDSFSRATEEARIASDTARDLVQGAQADIVEEIMRSNRPGFGTGSIRSVITRADTRGSGVSVDDLMDVVDTVSRRSPAEWVERLERHEIKWVKRGHYEFDNKRVNISGNRNDQGTRYFSKGSWQSTLHHELTHAFQFSNPTIPRAERLFMARRAQERAATAGDNFWQMTRLYPDNADETRLVLDLQPGDAYMDKAYGGFNIPGAGASPTEVSTVATERLYNSDDIAPEVRDFILGLLLLG